MDKTDNTPDPRETMGQAEPTFRAGQAEVTWNPGHPREGDTPDLRIPYPDPWETAERHGRVRYPLPPRRPQPPYNSLERPAHPESYPPPPPVQGAAVKGHNPGLTFLGMSGGILALVASAVILLFCVAPVVFCFGLGIVGAVTPTPSPSF